MAQPVRTKESADAKRGAIAPRFFVYVIWRIQRFRLVLVLDRELLLDRVLRVELERVLDRLELDFTLVVLFVDRVTVELRVVLRVG